MTHDDLDSMLDYLYKKGKIYSKFRDVQKDNPCLDAEAIIDHLRNDGYLIVNLNYYKEPALEDGYKEEELYKLSFKGIFFKERGGYKQQRINEVSESKRLERLERGQKANQNATLLLTIILAVATVIPAIPYVVEFLRHWGLISK